jgi:hypothetical protein
MLTVFFFSNNADEIKSIDQAVEYILAQPEGKLNHTLLFMFTIANSASPP